ncbi:hypothetical protein [Rummeliibacillus pycnus]|uniref:hypothetical protein n=1 Tax=Rummeliibacillus pycnus TaxID=101070 RepID=UPI003D2A9293
MKKKIVFSIIFCLILTVFSPSVYYKEKEDFSDNISFANSVENNKELVIGYQKADAWIALVGRLIIQGATKLIKVGSKTFKKVPKDKVVNALKHYKGTTFKTGTKTYKLTKTDMKHMLERHHPKYWNGSEKKKQTYYDSRYSIKDIENVAITVAKKNKKKLSEISANASGQVKAKVDGIEWVLGVKNGHIHQLYPVKK